MIKSLGPEGPKNSEPTTTQENTYLSSFKNSNLTPIHTCRLCGNGHGFKKFKITFRPNEKAWICSNCLHALGRGRILQILQEIPQNPEKLNLKNPRWQEARP